MMVADRLEKIEESATLKISDLAAKLKREGKDIISLSVGEPDFPTPQHIIQAAIKAMEDGHTHYTPSKGIPELREAISDKLRVENGIEYSPEEILVTPGAKHAIFEAVMATVNRGDEVILLEPSWVTYEACVMMAEAQVVWCPLNENFEAPDLQEYVSDKTKMIIVNSPNNPLGVVFRKEFLKEIRDIAVDHDLLVISDEIYEKIIYDGVHYSLASFDGMWERVITVNGFSKSYAMTGWRLGYAAAPRNIIDSMLKVQQHSVSCATSFVQYAGIAALKGDQQFLAGMVEEFEKRRDLLVNGLKEMGISYAPPDGAFYLFADVSSFGTGVEVSEQLLQEAYVAVTPGEAFGKSWRGWVRISYATSRENLMEALKRIKDVLI
jgi:aspartate aminotransferase